MTGRAAAPGGRAAAWATYLDAFHQAHPGITEAVLERAQDADGINPYQWLAQVVPGHGSVLDLACGSAPMRGVLPATAQYLGVDRSPAELATARTTGVTSLLRADATDLPIADASFDFVACSMALMLLTPLSDALAEIRRVLRGGGLLVATVPTTRPLLARDLAPAAALLLALRRPLHYPNDRALRHLPVTLAPAGFELLSDQRRRFALRLDQPGDARLLLDSLYLPSLAPARYRSALRVLRLAAEARSEIPIPLRRITARAR